MVGQRDDQMLCFTYTAPMIDRPIVVCDVDIDEFQGVVAQLPNDFSDDFREFAFYFIDQEAFEMPANILGCLDLYFFLAGKIMGHTQIYNSGKENKHLSIF